MTFSLGWIMRKLALAGLMAGCLPLAAGCGDESSAGGGGTAVCGNGVVETGEACDGADLNGLTCSSLGLAGDGLACTAACELDLSGCPSSVCGNGELEDGEACDDGNHSSGDGCSADCLSGESCGNGYVDVPAGEACDDGNLVAGDGCDDVCLVETGWTCSEQPSVCVTVCGDALVAGTEECDDGDTVPCDGCSEHCTAEACGNGAAECDEACDDGNLVAGDGCSADCLSDESCGNAVVDAVTGEVCDEGAANADEPNAACRTDCTPQRCGDGVVDDLFAEECDDGNTAAADGCSATCLPEICGNSIMDPGELCDDGNAVGGDGCSADCLSDEICGNGYVDAALGELCDDGGTDPGDGCGPTCLTEICGNGYLDPGEQCDDGNLAAGDGCDAACLAECGIPCSGPVQACIDAAANGDVLAIGPAPVVENVVVSGKELTLRGNCSGSLTSWTTANQSARAIVASAGADLTVEGFIFEGCNGGVSDSYNSGVMLQSGAGAVRLIYNIFRNNSSHRGPVISTFHGAAFPTDGYLLIENNIMHDNHADDGGVIYINGETYIDIVNNLIYDNWADDYCGAVWLRNQLRSKMTFRKNVVYGHTAGRNPALEVFSGEGPIINSSIVANNSPSNIAAAWGSAYSMIGGSPLFTSPATGDFSLLPTSAAIDAGDPALPNDPDATVTDQGCALYLLPVE